MDNIDNKINSDKPKNETAKILISILVITASLVVGGFCGYLIGHSSDESSIFSFINMFREPVDNEPPRYYIALGDSVAAGFGVDAEDRYTKILFEKLKYDGYVDAYLNLAVNGNTTSLLLDSLINMDEDELYYFQYASVITLNIGGNNILRPYLNSLPSFDSMFDIMYETMIVVSDAREVTSEVLETFSEIREMVDNISITNALSLITSFRDYMNLMDDVVEILNRAGNLELVDLIASIYNPLSEELERELINSVIAFENELGEILNWLDYNAPNAIVIINTIYNPIPRDFFGMTLNIYNIAYMYTHKINEIILSKHTVYGVYISDVYSLFEQELTVLNLMNFNLDTETLNLNFDIIHPNTIGHAIIAESNYSVFLVGKE